ncbi:hypothetical protein [Paracoccus zhejiangensis]|uniref:hypothetical protein n=1 Tax=Paracoccus zhejiangensis TaxID=1077935 RepID=UPI0012FFEB1A|nr:hypothetical protein [Paracoccus zhejiangensis]
MVRDKPRADLPGPRKLGPYPDRELDCQEVLEKGLLALVEKAEAAGWDAWMSGIAADERDCGG